MGVLLRVCMVAAAGLLVGPAMAAGPQRADTQGQSAATPDGANSHPSDDGSVINPDGDDDDATAPDDGDDYGDVPDDGGGDDDDALPATDPA
ncbi:MAG TPA: hypothetical protein VLW75_09570 [Rhizomicrobium sp.]|nr:hypothetical protein [Rhizomicrobium sp.]